MNELAGKDLEFGAPIFIRIFKKERLLEVWLKKDISFKLFKAYPICTYGSGGLGPKIRQGDGKAPEGFYFVTPSRLNPVSNFHLSFNLGYPNSYDIHHGRTGSALMVHGNCVSIGCYAMTDSGIEEIFTLADAAFRKGQSFFRVHIFPYKMTTENMEKYKENAWYGFWSNLKDGYDFFENNNRIPPNVEVRNGKYVFENQ
jgi:murein L,D-transpeptidase YafK